MVEDILGHAKHHESNADVSTSNKEEKHGNGKQRLGQTGTTTKPDNERIHKDYAEAKANFKKYMLGNFRRVGLKCRIVHDVYERPHDGLGERFRKYFIQALRNVVPSNSRSSGKIIGGGLGGRGRGLLFITEHQDHIHIIHDCTYSGGSCRCRFMRYFKEYTTREKESDIQETQWEAIERNLDIEIEDEHEKLSYGLGEASQGSLASSGDIGQRIGRRSTVEEDATGESGIRCIRRYARRSSPTAMFTADHWVNITEYCFKTPRQPYYIEVAGRAWFESNKIRCIQLLGLLEKAKDRVVEDSQLEKHIFGLFGKLACTETGGCASEGSIQAGKDGEKSTGRDKTCRLEKWLEGYIITPPQNIFYTGHWCSGPYKYWSKNHDLIKNSFHNMRQKICDLSIKSLFLRTRNIPLERLIYVGPWNNLRSYYYGIADSVKVLEKLLAHQYPDKHYRNIFMQNLYFICNKTLPKKNCMFVLGEPNSGKNYFFDCVCHAFINFGCMGNFNKYSNFPLQECVQRRIIQWNEPNFEPGSEETLKLLFGGDTCNVKVKYQGDACMLRTPIIVLSNNDCFPKGEAFRTRMFSEKWVKAPFLKHFQKKPHPLAIFYLFIKYKTFEMSTLEKWELEIINE